MTPFISFATNLMSLGIIAMQLFGLLLLLSLFLKKSEIKEKRGLGKLVVWVSKHILELGFLTSLASMLGSLFYSGIAHFAPCEFCWWQRILMYPQVLLFAVAWYYKKKGLKDSIATTTSLILSTIGALVGLFQYYAATFNPSLLEACAAQGVSCTKNYFTAFGYITIPMMSLTAFVLLILLVVTHKREVKLH